MMNQRIYLSPPHMGGEEQKYIAEAFETNWIAPLGPNVEGFELELAEYVGVQGALALSSGTAAIHLALRLLDVSAGDTVFCSSLTFVASANPILYQGATPVFIDSEPNTWNMSPDALERAMQDAETAGTLPKAVVIVNLYGQSADMEPLLAICDRYGVPVIEDAAESLGATYKGKSSGTFGRFGIYSFNGNKIISTSGGGMLVSDDIEALEKARFWSTQARDQARHYQHSELGYNYRMSNILAGVGRGQLRVLDDRIQARRAVFDRYANALADTPGFTFMPEAEEGYTTRWLTALTVDEQTAGVSAVQIVDALAEENIEARPVWKPLHLQPLFTDCNYYPHAEDRSVSDELFANGLCLPSGSSLTEEEQERVIAGVRRAIQVVCEK
ncbi:pyridoxal phosphate-dependent aminotransferase [Aneurinibacillus migulanus]|jgi:pyridoxal phosphate-dependent aminotransferase EpsN|uniref:Pyridoxal phosphate-dependent aminotransferase n=1 Tax=Aneurinibacillus migulanus TaxID=47500 RepID=A0A0D1XDC0_ANEMI|nr:DegT/DnrJ/EryC1/StrS family aminotransferase [Aneurinibacillus migulanus]KIV52376.1 pyridoxal phosphate-dependent aminotransferase [Aneurinibacillus migulanus]KIV53552.1 pyridoxal phosphate-dependent aminotransferase [Aneurinibacillus migulanus]KON94549.1 pyridoxal phosphate-dependent aminotransferase [Aneurinibacillus migulanus]KPD05592.1 pyridoxal phosphate-dependent aminotransferase [Aneurinibacillus migulanus]MED0892585.1 DegT/DnrJ/EryC1/StrS family aminotransferase [Aneurinibacillus mi